jgi:subtilisin family serine protease
LAFGASFPFHQNSAVSAAPHNHHGQRFSDTFSNDTSDFLERNWRENYSKHNRDDYQTAQIIVQTDGSQNLTETFGATEILGDPSGLHILQYPNEKLARVARERFNREKHIKFAEPNRIVSFNDDFQYLTTALITPQSTAQLPNRWGAERIRADEMKDYLAQNNKTENLTVAIVDSGVDTAHPFLSNRTVAGKNIINTRKSPADENGHGTHVAGTVADCTPANVKIMPVKVLNKNGEGTDMHVALGIRHAADNGAKVINLSLGGEGESSVQKSAVDYAVALGATVVAAAGNENADTVNYTPANYNNVITVAASTQDNNRAPFSNYGSAVDVSAPGVNITSTFLNKSYATASGTSMAAPHVSAAVAMLKIDRPSATPHDLKTAVCASAFDIGNIGGRDDFTGAGVVDMDIYIRSKIAPPEQILTPQNEAPPEQEQIENSDKTAENNNLKIAVFCILGFILSFLITWFFFKKIKI